SSPTALTHYVVDWPPATPPPGSCVPGAHAPGQGNPSPPPRFGNHFIVTYGGRYYDPSYGTGPFADQRAWEVASIDGVFRPRPAPPAPPPPPAPAVAPPPPVPPPNAGLVGSRLPSLSPTLPSPWSRLPSPCPT